MQHPDVPCCPMWARRRICGRMPDMARPREDRRCQRVLAGIGAAVARPGEPATGGRPRAAARLSGNGHRDHSRGRLERRGGALLRTVLTIVLFTGVLATVSTVLAVDLTHDGRATRPAAASGPASSTAGPSGTPSATTSATRHPRPADPFRGSPADSYASGQAGIVQPPAEAVGGYSAAQVGHAYSTVKRLLAAAHLDRSTLLAGPPAAFARLLVPAERRYFDQRLGWRGLTAQGWPRSSRAWVTSFAPGVQLATGVVKVHGWMHASAATRDGHTRVLRVKADFLFVYAVQRPGQAASRMRVVVRDVAWVDFGHWARPHGPLEPWWSPHGGATAGGQCGALDGFIHPAWPGDRAGRARPTGAPVDPYNQSGTASSQGCRPATGT